jgi:acyl transferase domain-containing protein
MTYAKVGLNPAETRFFEAHGTGTATGDPIEAKAISTMFSKYRSAEEPLFVGALKSNVGHAEGACGVSSVIKCILAAEGGIIPANANFIKRNPKIQDDWHLQVVTKARLWPKNHNDIRRSSINSFGVSGTNVHVVIDDAYSFLKTHGYTAPHRTVISPQLPQTISRFHLPSFRTEIVRY